MKATLEGNNSIKALLKYSVPMILMMIVINIYSIVDGLFVSNIVGDEAFSALNLVMPLIMLLGAIGFMVGTGGTALIGKYLGMKQNEEASKIFSSLIELLVIAGIILVAIGELLLEPTMRLMGADDDTVVLCLEYGRVLIAFVPFLMLQYSFQSFLGIADKGKIALGTTISVGVLNMICDFLFVYLFSWGLMGAALATALSWLLGSILPIVYFVVKKDLPIKLRFTKIRIKPIIQSLYNGLSEMLTNVSISIANIVFNYQLINIYHNTNGVFSLGIIMYVSYVFQGIFMGYAMGASQKVSYNFGAGNKVEISNILRRSTIILSIFAVILTGLSAATSYPFTYIFANSNSELLALASKAMLLYSFVFLLSGFNIFSSSFFTALGNGTISGIISLLKSLVFQVPLIFLLPLINSDLIWLSVFFSELLTLAVSIICIIVNKKKYGYTFLKNKKIENN